jgi:hypothetical protein
MIINALLILVVYLARVLVAQHEQAMQWQASTTRRLFVLYSPCLLSSAMSPSLLLYLSLFVEDLGRPQPLAQTIQFKMENDRFFTFMTVFYFYVTQNGHKLATVIIVEPTGLEILPSASKLSPKTRADRSNHYNDVFFVWDLVVLKRNINKRKGCTYTQNFKKKNIIDILR